jgi:serine/threonine protein kinase
MQPATNDTDISTEFSPAIGTEAIADYSLLLQKWGLSYTLSGHYLQVGDVESVRGWILDLTTSIINIQSVLETVIPLLLFEEVPFKIPVNKSVGLALVQGALGYSEIGKIICIFPPNAGKAVQIARVLLRDTARFRGPAVPTDYWLGSIVYARYGGFSPTPLTDHQGITSYFSYDTVGNLVPEQYAIPFHLPKGTAWPFSTLKPYKKPKNKRLLRGRYLVNRTIKTDVKGSVTLAFWFKKWWDIRLCVIKAGIKDMLIDQAGRDIQDKLKWQYILTRELEGRLNIPRAYDYFNENGVSNFVTEFVADSESVGAFIDRIHRALHWEALDPQTQQALVKCLLSILDFIGKFHESGYYHRDITSRNFLITIRDDISAVGIDFELAWNYMTRNPDPPFTLGSPGYMSPEQIRVEEPTAAQDIFGIGALMLRTFSGLSPKIFSIIDADTLYNHLLFLTKNESLAALIASCMSTDPSMRPALQQIKQFITAFASEIDLEERTGPSKIVRPSRDKCRDIIERGLACIGGGKMATEAQIWVSKPVRNNQYVSNESHETMHLPGLQRGVAGILYFIAAARAGGYDISACQQKFSLNWQYLHGIRFNGAEGIVPGLYYGSAGTCIAFAEGVSSGMIRLHPEMTVIIEAGLFIDSEDLTLATGLAGQGLATLQCKDIIDGDRAEAFLREITLKILARQETDGSWIITKEGYSKSLKVFGLSHGIAGIIYFLLRYYEHCKDPAILYCAECGLHFLKKQAVKAGDNLTWPAYAGGQPADGWLEHGASGMVLPFIKAFSLTGKEGYKDIAESVLRNHTIQIVTPYLSVSTGVAGIGEIYLEAWKAFKSMEWLHRAHWIVDLLLHTYQCQSDGTVCWITDNTTIPTADLLTGNAGILQFLMRWLDPEKQSLSIYK